MLNKYKVTKDLSTYCESKLNQKGLSYLQNRGVTPQSVKNFEIGYFPFQTAELQSIIDPKDLVESGIGFINKNTKEYYCPLQNYITFPIINQYNEYVAISGRPPMSNDRVKELKLRKYWHSIFDKKENLYGLNKAISHIRKEGIVIVGEGQFDTIIAHQYGIKNVVSTLGTALTSEHIKILARFANEILIVFDNDPAGQAALDKINEKDREGIEIRAIILPGKGEDIDSYIRKHGSKKFLSCLKSPDSLEHLF